ncbi:hypothetical protein [Ammoniphilus sp. YIM 78166]|uniref:hypothetical protein n=1 Tax=Ammoniphilus sp. YIM 78166 TaxID=1644106 RepID=UPI00106F3A85|nr:hypothetical protein [Ammoniphilus sp. YIM 78166]
MKKWLGICLLWAFLIIPWTGQAETWRDSFQQHIKQWAAELAQQDPRFASFTEAVYTYEGLGPNSKQWLITFSKDEVNVGYMVVGEDPSGFVLLEYGLGEYVLFDQLGMVPNTLQLEKHYAGLESVWVEEGRIYDAKSGEQYPGEAAIVPPIITSRIGIETSLASASHHPPDMLVEPWIKPGEVIQEDSQLKERMANSEISFIARLFQNTVIAPFKVVGYHQWGEELFVELDDYGSRYIPYQYAVKVGGFYQ